jgi:2-polyprenyl-6-methoxyphenol hydroxylase-like FAD-dependent oxidoreductase
MTSIAQKSVLISGGSIAGPAIAWWLHRYGFKTTLVERWEGLRPGGQNIDVNDLGVSDIFGHLLMSRKKSPSVWIS